MNYRQPMPARGPVYSGTVSAPCTPIPACENIMSYPIAMAYVPAQIFQSTYDLNQSLSAGTIFPELHKPFCGKRCMR